MYKTTLFSFFTFHFINLMNKLFEWWCMCCFLSFLELDLLVIIKVWSLVSVEILKKLILLSFIQEKKKNHRFGTTLQQWHFWVNYPYNCTALNVSMPLFLHHYASISIPLSLSLLIKVRWYHTSMREQQWNDHPCINTCCYTDEAH